MKSFLIIGAGKFGSHLCKDFARLENEILVIDQLESRVEPLLPFATSARIGDCTNEDVLDSLGVGNFDACFVCMGSSFQNSLEITSLLKEHGAKYVISKADKDIHAKFLLRNGADEVVYPERDIADKTAVRFSTNHVFDYIELADDFSIYEIPPLQRWVGKSISEINIRAKFNINILGLKKNSGEITMLPSPEYIFSEHDHLMIIGKKTDVEKIIKKL